jgi:hypothetical protein
MQVGGSCGEERLPYLDLRVAQWLGELRRANSERTSLSRFSSWEVMMDGAARVHREHPVDSIFAG